MNMKRLGLTGRALAILLMWGWLASAGSATTLQAQRLHVDAAAAPGGNGQSWATAFTTIADALAAAVAGDEIWIASGEYVLTDALTPPSGTQLYGGLPVGATSLSQRDTRGDPTWLIPAAGQAGLVLDGVTGCRVEGLWIIGGNQSAIIARNLDASSVIADCVLKDNAAVNGGGIFCESSSITIQDCELNGNTVTGLGGGIYIRGGTPRLLRCLIRNQRATDPYTSSSGAGLYCEATSATLEDCQLYANETLYGIGGGIAIVNQPAPTIRNCRIAVNSASFGGGLSIINSTPVLEGCTISGNFGSGLYLSGAAPVLTNCLISGNDHTLVPVTRYYLSRSGGLVATNASMPSLVHCTFADNGSKSSSHALYYTNDSRPQLSGVIIANQTYGIYREAGAAVPIMDHMLFHGNTADLYLAQSGATAANSTGDPRFLHSAGGVWSDVDLEVGADRTASLYDANANFEPGALAGRLLQLRAGSHAWVVDNTTTRVTVLTKLDLYYIQNKPYQFMDYRPGYGSAAIDAAPDLGMSLDIDGRLRPLDLPDHGTTHTYDIGAYEAQGDEPGRLKCQPQPLVFPTVMIGSATSSDAELTLRNLGFAPLTISGFTLGGAHMNEFAFITNPSMTPLAPGETRTLALRFTPTGKWRTATLSITSDDPAQPVVIMTMTGTQIAPPLMQVSLNNQPLGHGDSFDFGIIAQGAMSPAHGLRLYNAGESDLTISGLTLPGGFLHTVYLPKTLMPGYIGFGELLIDTSQPGRFAGTVAITTNEPARPVFEFTVTGTVSGPFDPALVWIDFANPLEGEGTLGNPFRRLGAGADAAAAGATLRIQAGSTSETLRLIKPLRLEAVGGLARIGSAQP